MSRGKPPRPHLPTAEKLRVEHERRRRHVQRAEQQRQEQAVTSTARADKRARKQRLFERRRTAAGLPRPLRCSVESGALGTVGFRRAFRETAWGDLVITGILLIPTLLAWAPHGPDGPRSVGGALLLTLVTLLPLARYLRHVRQAASEKVPCDLSASVTELTLRWKEGPSLTIPIGNITRAEMSPMAPPGFMERSTSKRGTPGATVVIEREDDDPLHVAVWRRNAVQLVAAIEVARDDLAARRAQPKKRPPSKVEAPRESRPPPTPPEPPPPNEAALAALDREGRSIEAWREALRAAFADTGYRRTPPLPPEELLHVVTDRRISAERRIGAALAISLRADDDLRGRLRVASSEVESRPLRVAMERAAEGDLGDEGLDEALSAAEAGRTQIK